MHFFLVLHRRVANPKQASSSEIQLVEVEEHEKQTELNPHLVTIITKNRIVDRCFKQIMNFCGLENKTLNYYPNINIL